MSDQLIHLLAALSASLFAIIIVSLLAWLVLPMKQVAALFPWFTQKKEEELEKSFELPWDIGTNILASSGHRQYKLSEGEFYKLGNASNSSYIYSVTDGGTAFSINDFESMTKRVHSCAYPVSVLFDSNRGGGLGSPIQLGLHLDSGERNGPRNRNKR